MFVKIATRVFNEEQFTDPFIRYYLDLGVDEIHFFDSGSQDRTLNMIAAWSRQNPAVKLIISDPELRHTSSSIETRVCNRLLQHAMQDTLAHNEDCWWLFLDIDEFLRPPLPGLKPFLEQTGHPIIRSVFFEWYLAPDQMSQNYSPLQILDLVQQGSLKGKLLDLVGDPFYKDQTLLFTRENLQHYSNLRTIAGNHRYFLNQEIIVPPNQPFWVIDHLKGVSVGHMRTRVEQWLSLLDQQPPQIVQDEWTRKHFCQLREQITDYTQFYHQALATFAELEARKPEIAHYDNEMSLYNTIAF